VIRNLNVETITAEICADIVNDDLLDRGKAQCVAEIVVAGLRHRYGGDELYIPVAATSYPVKAILQDYAKGDSVRTVCKRHGISRSTFYRLLNRA